MDKTMKAKLKARDYLLTLQDKVIALSHQIHQHPELAFKEEKACTWLTETLAEAGFAVEKGICHLPTAFRASIGRGTLHIAFCAEYDALPEIGHACGHNIIAAAAVGAAIAAAAIADECNLTINVLGTPAEENGGGKILMLEDGAFKGIHAAMMIHPAPFDLIGAAIIAQSSFTVRYTGKEAHASALPEQGINAADALTIAQIAIGLLRQHILPTDRIHGIITKGGDAANVIPAHTEAHYIVRSKTLDGLKSLREKVWRCFEAGALATGATLEIIETEKPYAHLLENKTMATLYQRNAEALGRQFTELGELKDRMAVSTDMGNVSQVIPVIHPMIGIESGSASNHQPAFAACSISKAADKAIIDGALAMAWTAIDMATEAHLREQFIAREM